MISKMLHFCLVCLTEMAVVVPFLVLSIVNYTVYNQGGDSFYLPFQVMYVLSTPCSLIIAVSRKFPLFFFLFTFNLTNQRIPWDWRAPFKYVIALIAQTIAKLCTLYCVAPVIAFVIGSCWLFCAFLEDITEELYGLRAERLSIARQNEMKGHFCKIMRLYSDVKQLSDDEFVCKFNEYFQFSTSNSL